MRKEGAFRSIELRSDRDFRSQTFDYIMVVFHDIAWHSAVQTFCPFSQYIEKDPLPVARKRNKRQTLKLLCD